MNKGIAVLALFIQQPCAIANVIQKALRFINRLISLNANFLSDKTTELIDEFFAINQGTALGIAYATVAMNPVSKPLHHAS